MTNRCKKNIFIYTAVLIVGTSQMTFSNSNELIMLDDFDPSPKVEWNFVADSVMGGVSSGEVLLGSDGSETFASMIGNVSTENNGGFIQFRSNLDERLDKEVKGVYLKVKGNGEKYYIHLRTRGTMLPWQYYQSAFLTQNGWAEIFLPLDSFMPSGSWLSKGVNPTSIRSIGVVAYGRDHVADIQVTEIGFYL